MKKLYSAIFIFFLYTFSHTVFAQYLTFQFAGSDGDEASWPSTYNGPSIQPSTITRGGGVAAIPNGDRFNSNNWTTTTSIDLNDYIEFTITPVSGATVTVSGIQMQHQRSSTGPRSFVIRTSIDGYSTDATNVINIADINTLQNSTFTFTPSISTSSSFKIRIYAYAAETATGTWGPGESSSGDDIAVFSTISLPVKLSNLKATQKNNKIQLTFSNSTESDVQTYTVERSTDGRKFIAIKDLDPLKNNGGKVAYDYFDNEPLQGHNYYRIKAIELDGKTVFSSVAHVLTSIQPSFTVYPNPSTGPQLSIATSGLPKGNYFFTILGGSGQKMIRNELNLKNNNLNHEVQLPAPAQKGVYMLIVSDGNALRLTKRFVVE